MSIDELVIVSVEQKMTVGKLIFFGKSTIELVFLNEQKQNYNLAVRGVILDLIKQGNFRGVSLSGFKITGVSGDFLLALKQTFLTTLKLLIV